MDGPSIEEILPAVPEDPRARRLAAVFGVPGLTVALLVGVVGGFAAGSGDTATAAGASPSAAVPSPVGASDPASGTASPGSPSEPAITQPAGTDRPRASGDLTFPTTAESEPIDRWPPALLELLRTAPTALDSVAVSDETGQVTTTGGGWVVTLTSSSLEASARWFSGLLDWLPAHGFSSASLSQSGERPLLRYIDAPGFLGTFVGGQAGRSYSPTAVAAIRLRISARSMYMDGSFRDDPGGPLERIGCGVDQGSLPAAVARLVGAVDQAAQGHLESVEAGRCTVGDPANPRDEWLVVGRVVGLTDASGIAPILQDALGPIATGLVPWAFVDDASGDPIAIYGRSVGYSFGAQGGIDCGISFEVHVRRDEDRPEAWAVSVQVWPDGIDDAGEFQVRACG